eukprot:TRINITY_DN83758_c0_g1_i1.p1 TRINITY_DN83758_c0_g1~~TRINITY_DN83758_c0_g1_i1.p1  ORF type:complete len:285 (+),score=61.07 TRINITY_DN83758_c0_g1_i1:54-857(+)
MATFRRMLLLAAAPCVWGTVFRRQSDAPPDVPTESEIDQEFGAADQSVEALFESGCTMRHSSEIKNTITDRVIKGEITTAQVALERRKLEKKMAADMSQQCSMSSVKVLSECQKGCQQRYADDRKTKIQCGELCNTNADLYKKDCKAKVIRLQAAYDDRANTQEKELACYSDHCKNFQSVWRYTDKDKITAEVANLCELQCTDNDDSSDSCKATCKSGCESQKMLDCVAPIKAIEDPTTKFCQDLWSLLHTSSKYDSETLFPVVKFN